jgi:hypothetical protein
LLVSSSHRLLIICSAHLSASCTFWLTMSCSFSMSFLVILSIITSLRDFFLWAS